MKKVAVLFAFISALACLPGCALLEEAVHAIQKPTLAHKDTALIKSPTTSSLLAYYCPDLLGEILCTPALGAAPAKESLRFDFELTFQVDNPTSVDIPTLSMLLATSLFPNEPNVAELGLTCVKFCDPEDTTCTGQGAAEDCAGDPDQPDLFTFDDFADSATDRLLDVANGDLDAAYADNFGIDTIPANGSKDLKIAFSLGVDPMTNILGKVTTDYVNNYFAGVEEPIEVPYDVKGTLWVDVPLNLGRYGLAFGPEANTWELAF